MAIGCGWITGSMLFSSEIEDISRTEENCVNVMTIPGIGPMISTGMVTAIGTGDAFDRGRDFGAPG